MNLGQINIFLKRTGSNEESSRIEALTKSYTGDFLLMIKDSNNSGSNFDK
jgi:hypothetical protein